MIMKFVLSIILMAYSMLIFSDGVIPANVDRHFVIVSASYNNKKWYKQSLDSVFGQSYSNWHLIYIDDCSPDGTGQLVEDYIQECGMQDKVTLIRNEERIGSPLANQYKAIHMSNDLDVIVILDGDDWLYDSDVLSYLNEVYKDPNIWLTWGQFIEWPTMKKGFAAKLHDNFVKKGNYRHSPLPISHLRTFYAWLFKLIKKEDLYFNGKFFPMSTDKAMFTPMIEMAAGRFKFIDRILCVYNFQNPRNCCRVDGTLQASLAQVVRTMKPYQKLENPVINNA